MSNRGMKVIAVDNGPMDKELMATGLVTHVKADGFTFRPERPAAWLICDMVAPPTRVARLIANWAVRRDLKEAIFNLKLPSRSRLGEVNRSLEIIRSAIKEAGGDCLLTARHLYHDRDEVTCHLKMTSPCKGKKKTERKAAPLPDKGGRGRRGSKRGEQKRRGAKPKQGKIR